MTTSTTTCDAAGTVIDTAAVCGDPDVRRVYDNPLNRERRAWAVYAAFGARTPEQVREAWGAREVSLR